MLRIDNAKVLQLVSGTIRLNGEVMLKLDLRKWKQDKNGFSIVLDMPENIPYGLQQISHTTITQKILSTSFIVSHIDEFEKNNSGNQNPIPLKEIIND